ncbi:MAG: hypothetical protein AB7F86_15030 [Bdellovibrionales bacterium]
MGWTEQKVKVRVWVEHSRKTRGAWHPARWLAEVIWIAHIGPSRIRNYPRHIRIWLTVACRLKSNWLRPLLLPVYWLVRLIDRIFHRERLLVLSPSNLRDIGLDERLQSIVRGLNEGQCSSQERDQITEAIAQLTNQRVSCGGSEKTSPAVDVLKEEGIMPLPHLGLSAVQVQDIVRYFKSMGIYGAHLPVFSDGVARKWGDPNVRNFPFGSYTLADSVHAPHLLELGLNKDVLSLVENYFGCAPSLFSIHAWWSFPGHLTAGPQIYHRDHDDYRFLALFVYLTDVEGGEFGGEHEFIKGSHRIETMRKHFAKAPHLAEEFFYPRFKGNSADEVKMYKKLFSNKVTPVVGKKGSVFLADTFGLHKGVPPKSDDRLVCWIRYGLRKNLAYVTDKFSPVEFNWTSGRVPDDAYHRHVTRLILRQQRLESGPQAVLG